MSVIEELNDEELDKVTGGVGEDLPTRNVIATYKETEDGIPIDKDLGRYEIEYAQANGENMAKTWCTENNKIYTGWHLANLLTNNYETRILLDSLGTVTVKPN